MGRGVGHQGADRVVAAQVAPDLLLNQVGGLRPQDRPRSALVGLEFVEGALDLPPLRVDDREVFCARSGWVEDGTDVYLRYAEQAVERYPRLNYQKAAYWVAIRDDLITNTESDALAQLRAALGDEGTLGANLNRITDLRLLDMLTWQ